MRRRVNLRQIEVFKAVIEHGTVSAAAAALHVSQPAMSKSLAQLEADTELRLFERVKGRLAPTETGMRLYGEIDRIFSGVQQVENAVDALHRQAQGRLLIGVMPGLSGAYVRRVVTAFLRLHPGTYCAVEARSSEWIMEALVGRRLDVGLVSARMENPYVETELLTERDAVCIMPIGHPLARRRRVVAADLAALPFISLGPESAIGVRIAAMFAAQGVDPPVALVANLARTVCEFVAAGTGVSLMHPLMVSETDRLVVRPFEPPTVLGFMLAHNRAHRSARLVDEFSRLAHATADAMMAETMLKRPEPASSRPRRQQA